MLLSSALGLNKSQPMLDFVDIDLDLDFPLYIDPAGFLNPRDDFAEKCQIDIQDFFKAVLKAISKGDDAKGAQLLAALREPNETHLGVSAGEPKGRGLGSGQAVQVMLSLKNSPAGKSGLLRDLTDVALFIDGIGIDKISDMTTNIIRRHLIEYTQQEFDLMKIMIPDKVPTGLIWDTGQGRWINDSFDRIPVINCKRVLLVPKRYVRWKGGLQQASSKYYNHFVTNFIRDEQLATNGKLVEVIKTKKQTKKIVRKSKIKEEFPLNKKFLADFSALNPREYEKFRASYDRYAPIPLRTLVEARGASFNETQFSQGLITSLKAIPTGVRSANQYHHLILGILTFLFYPDLIAPVLEAEIDDGRKRIDISFSNSSDDGFFHDRKFDPFTRSREVMVECKNYTDDIANPEIDQLNGRFDPRRGLFGLIICRTIVNHDVAVKRCADVFKAQRGLIIVLSDDDIIEILSADLLSRRSKLQVLLRRKLREVST